MVCCRLNLLAATVLLLSQPAAAGEPLRWKFSDGQELKYVASQKSLSTINANGVDLESRWEQTVDMTWTVHSVAEDGSALLGQRVDRFRLEVASPLVQTETGTFSYDSQSGPNEEGATWDFFRPLLEATLGQEFLLRVSPTGQVSEIHVPDRLAKAIAEQPSRRLLTAAGALFSIEAIHQTLELSVLRLPDEVPETGAVWQQKIERAMPPIGTLHIDLGWTYQGTASRCGQAAVVIDLKTTPTYEPTADKSVDVSLELTNAGGSGKVYFDAAAGRTLFAESETKLVLDGDYMGNSFNQETTTTSTLLLAGCEE